MAMRSKWLKIFAEPADETIHFTDVGTLQRLLSEVAERVQQMTADCQPQTVWLHPNRVGNLLIVGEWEGDPDPQTLGYIDLANDSIEWWIE